MFVCVFVCIPMSREEEKKTLLLRNTNLPVSKRTTTTNDDVAKLEFSTGASGVSELDLFRRVCVLRNSRVSLDYARPNLA